MSSLTIKQGSTYPPLQVTLSDENGPINLTTAVSVELAMKGTSTLVTGSCVITSPTTGQITYNWGATDLNVIDTYNVEFQITWPSSKFQFVPNSGYDSIQVVATLGE